MKKMVAFAIVTLLMLWGCEQLTNPSYTRCPGQLRCKQAEVCCARDRPILCGGKCYATPADAVHALCFIDTETCYEE
jgi:hypothetical protein